MEVRTVNLILSTCLGLHYAAHALAAFATDHANQDPIGHGSEPIGWGQFAMGLERPR